MFVYDILEFLISVLVSYLLFFDHRISNQCFSVCCLFVHIYGCNLRILICSVIVNSPIHVTAGRIYGYLIFSLHNKLLLYTSSSSPVSINADTIFQFKHSCRLYVFFLNINTYALDVVTLEQHLTTVFSIIINAEFKLQQYQVFS